MPRPSLRLPNDVIAIAKGLKAEGIKNGMIRCPDGTEVKWGDGNCSEAAATPLQEWRAKRDAAS